MKSELDKSYTWFLDRITYENALKVYLQEGLQGKKADIIIGNTNLGTGTPIQKSDKSKRACIEFDQILSWQCIDESATTCDKAEISDSGKFISTLRRSAYLDFILAEHKWYIDLNGPVTMYRIWTENDIVEVVAYAPPVVEILNI